MTSKLHVFIIGGTGLIGTSLRKMMTNKSVFPNPNIVLIGYCNSKMGVKLGGDVPEQITPWNDSVQFDDAFVSSCVPVAQRAFANICIADCTASEAISDQYLAWLAKGWHICTPNKKCNSGPAGRYQACLAACQQKPKSKWYTEATIGAGLPIVSTLRTLRATGDNILQIQGIFSGTMSFLFNTWNPETDAFSKVVAKAKEAGYTEPDPREDLNGMDVARKVVIAAREAGWTDLELSQVRVESLVPAELEQCSTQEFMQQYPKHDAALWHRAMTAKEAGKVLRFVGVVNLSKQTASVQLKEMAKTHPFAGLAGADNILEITTARYGPTGSSTPLIIRGPGAGADVTAAGVLGDIVALSNAK